MKILNEKEIDTSTCVIFLLFVRSYNLILRFIKAAQVKCSFPNVSLGLTAEKVITCPLRCTDAMLH